MRGQVGETVLDRYRLEALLAEGGFGQVWKARQVSLGRLVAIKTLRSGRREVASLRERFRREAMLVAAISHPHVVTYHDFGVDRNGDLVLVMEYLEGCTLLDLFRQGRVLPLSRIVTWISEAAEGLWEAHALGIVHRDIKPSNLFVVDPGGRREHLKVIDFGILQADPRAHPDLEPLTGSGLVVGTPEYLAPEVVLGHGVDARGDQYALALVAFEMIALRRAFPPLEEGGMMARIAGRPEGMDMTFTGRRVPVGVQEALWRALSPIPDERYPTIRDFGRALRTGAGLDASPHDEATRVAVSSLTPPEEATRTFPTRPAHSPGRGSRGRLALGLMVVGAALGLGAWWGFGAVRSPAGAPGEFRPDAGATSGSGGPESVGGPRKDPAEVSLGIQMERSAGAPEGSSPGKSAGEATGPKKEPGDPRATGEGGRVPRVTREDSPPSDAPVKGGGMGRSPPVTGGLAPRLASERTRNPRESGMERDGSETAGAEGRVSLNAIPWADVLLDGRPIGRTPLRDLAVPAGIHRVRFEHPERGAVERDLQVEPGIRQSLVVPMGP